MLELAKALKLVAPITMSADAQMVWLQAAADALEDIRADEVRAISAELRRKVTRPAQIVPEIASLVAAKRVTRFAAPPSPYAREMEIDRKAQQMRIAASGDRARMNDASEWERQERISAGLHVRSRSPLLSSAEIDAMPAHIRQLGLNYGFLTRRDGRIAEA